LYVIRTSQRDLVRRALEKQGIETMIHYPVPPYRQKAYADLDLPRGSFPIADRLADEVLSLPMGPHLTDSDWIPVLRNTILETTGTGAPIDSEQKQRVAYTSPS